MSDLRQQAVEAISDAVARSPVRAVYERADDIAFVALAAAEPFIRAQVVQEIVTHLRSEGYELSATEITHKFGSS